MIEDLLDGEGENQAVRDFLMQYTCDRAITVGFMRGHMRGAGWDGCWPNFVANSRNDERLTKAGAQLWIRHLFSLEHAEKEVPDSHVIPPPRGTGSQQDAFERVLTDEQMIAAWDAQWRHHGHEPCKLGHVEFGRTVEVMVATRCRAEGGGTSPDVSVINYGNPVDNCSSGAAGTDKPCRNEIINSGTAAWPRTCPRCGLAKDCPAGIVAGAQTNKESTK